MTVETPVASSSSFMGLMRSLSNGQLKSNRLCQPDDGTSSQRHSSRVQVPI